MIRHRFSSLFIFVATIFCGTLLLPSFLLSAESWLVRPYLQNPSTIGMTVRWVTSSSQPGTLSVYPLDSDQIIFERESSPELKEELQFHPTEAAQLSGHHVNRSAYLHRIRIEGLQSGTTYRYRVVQDGSSYSAYFRTSPDENSAIRFMVYADSETEPESTGNPVDWPKPFSKESRRYVVDQTEGYRQNLRIMAKRRPDFIAIAGDLVEKGGRQLDWEEFWRHNSGELNNLASYTPILPAVGNHENYAGPAGAYTLDGARWSIAKYQTYFETPDNGSGNPAFDSRYYRVDYGPITWITLDSSAGSPHQSERDSNFMLLGENDGGDAPDFNPGSTQYRWLETQLEEAAKKAKFIFIQFHHVPYSIGPHGLPAGEGKEFDNQSGQPLRILSPLFERYGVAAVFCGHDEIYEHSVVNGVHYYDIGIGGDGLRGPFLGEDGSTGLPSPNPHQVFLAHLHAPEVWEGNKLIDGGKHYGHIEVNVQPLGPVDSGQFDGGQFDGGQFDGGQFASGKWEAEILPVYVFPIMNDAGRVIHFERRIYDDTVRIVRP